MSKYRSVQVSFWQDAFVLDLTPEEKYFYIYLMTNSKANQIGIYELPKRIIETETGYNRETVEKLLKRFVEYDKIVYNEPTKEVMLLNWSKHNWNNSPKVIKRVEDELKEVKFLPFVEKYSETVDTIERNTVSIQYPDSMDIREKRKEKREKEKEKEKEIIPFQEIVSYLNQKVGTNYRASSKRTQQLINARWNEKFTLNDFKDVIDKKTSQWLGDEKRSIYLRPETLFGTKFESYLNEKVGVNTNGRQGSNHAAEKQYADGLNF
ncbi:replication protein [Psychrobacillus phage PVJ1]|nr:replication protein [Psychrobacillus phage PVJ1]